MKTLIIVNGPAKQESLCHIADTLSKNLRWTQKSDFDIAFKLVPYSTMGFNIWSDDTLSSAELKKAQEDIGELIHYDLFEWMDVSEYQGMIDETQLLNEDAQGILPYSNNHISHWARYKHALSIDNLEDYDIFIHIDSTSRSTHLRFNQSLPADWWPPMGITPFTLDENYPAYWASYKKDSIYLDHRWVALTKPTMKMLNAVDELSNVYDNSMFSKMFIEAQMSMDHPANWYYYIAQKAPAIKLNVIE